MGYLSTEVEGTGIIFGFLKQLNKIHKLYKTNKFLFAWDSKNSKRRELFPTYRLHPQKEISEEERQWHNNSFKQFTLIRKEILPSIGFYNSFKQKGYEADDIIASLVNTLEDKKIIVSADEDMYQLLNDNTIIYDIKKKVEFTKDCFVADFGIQPEQWVEVKTIGGCVSDKVPGCKGVGEKTAIDYLNGKLKIDSNKYVKIQNFIASEEYLCYNKLVTLPFEGTKTFEIDYDEEYDFDNFLQICKRFKFNSFLMPDMLNEWKKFLRKG